MSHWNHNCPIKKHITKQVHAVMPKHLATKRSKKHNMQWNVIYCPAKCNGPVIRIWLLRRWHLEIHKTHKHGVCNCFTRFQKLLRYSEAVEYTEELFIFFFYGLCLCNYFAICYTLSIKSQFFFVSNVCGGHTVLTDTILRCRTFLLGFQY